MILCYHVRRLENVTFPYGTQSIGIVVGVVFSQTAIFGARTVDQFCFKYSILRMSSKSMVIKAAKESDAILHVPIVLKVTFSVCGVV